MNFRSRQKHPNQLQMTAMMDIIFILLCFFIASSVFSQWENEVNLTLPTAKTAEMPIRLSGEIIININALGNVSINNKVLDAATLSQVLTRIAKYMPGQPVIIRADKTAHYQHFMKVVDACRAVGIANLSLATTDETDQLPKPAQTFSQPPPPVHSSPVDKAF